MRNICAFSEGDVITTIGVLKKVAHHPKDQWEAILFDWWGKKAKYKGAIQEAIKRYSEGR